MLSSTISLTNSGICSFMDVICSHCTLLVCNTTRQVVVSDPIMAPFVLARAHPSIISTSMNFSQSLSIASIGILRMVANRGIVIGHPRRPHVQRVFQICVSMGSRGRSTAGISLARYRSGEPIAPGEKGLFCKMATFLHPFPSHLVAIASRCLYSFIYFSSWSYYGYMIWSPADPLAVASPLQAKPRSHQSTWLPPIYRRRLTAVSNAHL